MRGKEQILLITKVQNFTFLSWVCNRLKTGLDTLKPTQI